MLFFPQKVEMHWDGSTFSLKLSSNTEPNKADVADFNYI